jgi:hypothetical protein
MQLDQERLMGHLRAAIQYANMALPRLDDYSAHWSEKEPATNRLKDKVIAETALLWYEASQVPNLPADFRALLLDLAGKLRTEASHERTKVMLLGAPQTVLWLGLAHILLSRLGMTDPEVESIVYRALNGHYSQFTERLPFREMDARWTKSIALRSTAKFDDLLPRSIVTAQTHPIYMTRDDAYALTHSIIYLTDFGRNRLPSSVDHVPIRELIDATIAWQLWSDNLDLVAELLLCNHMLHGPWSAYAQLAWHVLDFAWSSAPTLPGPFFDERQYALLDAQAGAAYKFEHSYHTAYVGGLLCATLLRIPMCSVEGEGVVEVSGAPPLRAELAVTCRVGAQSLWRFASADGHEEVTKLGYDSGSDAVDIHQGASSTALRVLRCVGRPEYLTARWIAAVDNAAVPAEELASVLYDAALIQVVRRYDLAALQRTLIDVADLNLPLTRSVVAAVEFLANQLLPSGALGAHFVRDANRSTPAAATAADSFAKCLHKVSCYLDKERN